MFDELKPVVVSHRSVSLTLAMSATTPHSEVTGAVFRTVAVSIGLLVAAAHHQASGCFWIDRTTAYTAATTQPTPNQARPSPMRTAAVTTRARRSAAP